MSGSGKLKGNIVDIHERTIFHGEIAFENGKITELLKLGDEVQGETYLLPGFIDAHIHIESSMMTACAYAEAALLNGTTTIFCDSHEIGNVCDAAGVEWMLRDARLAPLNIFLTFARAPEALKRFLQWGNYILSRKNALDPRRRRDAGGEIGRPRLKAPGVAGAGEAVLRRFRLRGAGRSEPCLFTYFLNFFLLKTFTLHLPTECGCFGVIEFTTECVKCD